MKHSRGRAILGAAALYALAALNVARADTAATPVKEVDFSTSCQPAVQPAFRHAVWTLHSFWYLESLKEFTTVAQADPGCAMAWWGVAMSHWHQLWEPPTQAELAAGAAAVTRAEAIGGKTEREKSYIAAIALFYKDSGTLDHHTRAVAYEKAMADLHQRYPDDREAAIFYALSLDATALPSDKTNANQKQAAAILEPLFVAEPDHPGVAHYLIHSYDEPPLAAKGLPAARRYASIAPDVPHALHMPGHIFTRLGLWQESIDSNRRAAEAGQAYAKTAFGEGVALAQSLHAMDYLAYAYLQKAEDKKVQALVEEIAAFKKATPETRVTAYAMAAIPARYALERQDWALAAKLEKPKAEVGWDKFPPAQAIIDFARALGDARTGDLNAAKAEIDKLAAIRDALKPKNKYWSDQVEVQRLAAAATLSQAAGRHDEAVEEMRGAATLDDATDKSNVTPGDNLPPRELLGDLLLEQEKSAAALAEYKRSLADAPNRFRSLIGEARAAKQAGDTAQAHEAYQKLLAQCPSSAPARPELAEAKAHLTN